MYALSDVGQKTARGGYRGQNNGKLKFDHKLSKAKFLAYPPENMQNKTFFWRSIKEKVTLN